MAFAKRDISLSPISAHHCHEHSERDEAVVSSNESAFEGRYLLGEQLGWGQFGIIRKCSDKLTGEVFACKSIAKDRLINSDDLSSVKLEIEIMTRLSGHPNIVYLKEVYEEENFVHLVMELCAGGELFHRLEKHGRFPESQARVLFKHLMEVVMYCHCKGIVHRDLKPENILLATKSPFSPIKLADFGLATYIKPGQCLYETVGSPFYIAPEVLSGSYNEVADVWSAGVILYILLSGNPPFWGKTKSRIFDAVRAADLQFPPDVWSHVSSSAKDLISQMLSVDPMQRLTAAQVLDHDWIKDYREEPEGSPDYPTANCGQLNNGDASFCTSLVYRTRDFTLQSASPAPSRENLPVYTCRSSFAFLAEAAHSTVGSECFSFCSCIESDSVFYTPPVAHVSSFKFSNPVSPREEPAVTLESDGNYGAFFASVEFMERGPVQKEHREAEGIAGSALASKIIGVHSRRNRTIGFGELEQLNLVVTETVIRWMSCTHLPSTPSLRSSLVC